MGEERRGYDCIGLEDTGVCASMCVCVGIPCIVELLSCSCVLEYGNKQGIELGAHTPVSAMSTEGFCGAPWMSGRGCSAALELGAHAGICGRLERRIREGDAGTVCVLKNWWGRGGFSR